MDQRSRLRLSHRSPTSAGRARRSRTPRTVPLRRTAPARSASREPGSLPQTPAYPSGSSAHFKALTLSSSALLVLTRRYSFIAGELSIAQTCAVCAPKANDNRPLPEPRSTTSALRARHLGHHRGNAPGRSMVLRMRNNKAVRSSVWRWLAVALPALGGAVATVFVALAGATPARHASVERERTSAGGATSNAGASPPSTFAVGLRVLRLVDRSRTIRLHDGRSEPRTLMTYVRYPALAPSGGTDVLKAPAASAGGLYPLIVFAHGFAVTPQTYSRLLQSWARAGYVVAAPVFPLSNAKAPGGPDEADVVNQPADMSFVISRLLSLSRAGNGPLAGLVDPGLIAVAGHSDGAETALASAYSRRFRDRRIGAAVILSGAEMEGVGGYKFTRGGPPLLAAQGTADTFNEAKYTNTYFQLARRPKFLLRLLGAGHLPPYSYQQPQLVIVERVTIAFLDRYLRRDARAEQRLTSLGDVAGTSTLVAEP